MQQEFETEHKTRYGFIQPEKKLIVESVSVELIQKMDTPEEPIVTRTRSLKELPLAREIVKMFAKNKWYDAKVYQREDLQPDDCIEGAAIIIEKISTVVVEPNWKVRVTNRNNLILERT